ncbi:hypothetical protein G9A89_009618 [Geosiphon pyriformis]|nr:hypothetical protein G9A89_009618 [Geosiphon pyriformis]
MDIETTLSSTTFKKKTSKSAFHDSVGGFFFQKKKVVLGNVKHSSDKRDISLSRSGSSNNVYSDVESLSGEDENVSMSDMDGGFLLGSAATTPKAKQVSTGAVFGSPFSSSNFHIDDDKVVLPPCLSIFISESSIEMATSLAREKVIDVNKNLKRQGMRAGKKTCVINRSLETGNKIHCAVVSFKFDNDLEFAFCTEPILGGVKLSWAKIDLVWCKKCEKFGHSALKCDGSVAFPSKLSRTFKSPSGGPCFSSGYSFGFPLSDVSDSNSSSPFVSANNSFLNARLDTLKCFLELLMNQVSGILKKLSGMELILMATSFSILLPATPTSLVPHLNVDMVLNDKMLASTPPLSAVDDVVHNSSSSFSKVLISKMGKLELKMVAFEVLIGSVLESLVWKVATCNVRDMNNPAKQEDIVRWHKNKDNMISVVTETKLKGKICLWIMNKFDGIRVFTSGLEFSYLDTDITIIMNASLAKHMCKVFEMPGQLISVKLLFKNKFSLMVLGLYAGATLEKRLVYSHVIVTHRI